MKITEIIVGDSVHTTNCVEESTTVLTTSGTWIWTLSIVEFLNTLAVTLTVIEVGFTVHTTNRLVYFGASTFTQTRALVLETLTRAAHHTSTLIGNKVGTTNWGKVERAGTVFNMRGFVVWNSTRAIGRLLDACAFTQTAKTLVGNSIDSTNGVENVIT